MMDLKIEYVPIDSIKPYKGNAKKHPKKQIEQIKQSIIAMKDADGDLLTGFKILLVCGITRLQPDTGGISPLRS